MFISFVPSGYLDFSTPYNDFPLRKLNFSLPRIFFHYEIAKSAHPLVPWHAIFQDRLLLHGHFTLSQSLLLVTFFSQARLNFELSKKENTAASRNEGCCVEYKNLSAVCTFYYFNVIVASELFSL